MKLPSLLVLASLLGGGVARAADPIVAGTYTRTWPVTLDVHALVGVEPQPGRGNPVAFGLGAELLWRGRLGFAAALLGSEGTPLEARTIGGVNMALPDRLSVPIAFAWRPFTTLAQQKNAWVRRLLEGIDLQVGLSVEHLRVSDADTTTAAFHLGAALELPIWGGPVEGGVALRLQGRFFATRDVTLDPGITPIVFARGLGGQFFGGIAFYP